MSAPVTQWFDYNRFDFPTNKPRQSRCGWYDVKRGKSRLEWRAHWNGIRFSQFRCLTTVPMRVWFKDICKYPFVTAWRGLADKPA